MDLLMAIAALCHVSFGTGSYGPDVVILTAMAKQAECHKYYIKCVRAGSPFYSTDKRLLDCVVGKP